MARKSVRRLYYESLWIDYPDVVDIYGLREMLGGIPEATGLRLLNEGHIPFLETWRQRMIPKQWIIEFVLSDDYAHLKEQLKYTV